MERLTESNPTWIDDEFWITAKEPDDEQIDEVYQRLKSYEDTGLTPEEITHMITDYNKTLSCETCPWIV